MPQNNGAFWDNGQFDTGKWAKATLHAMLLAMVENFFARYVSWLEKRYLLVLIFGAIISLFSAYYTVQLYKNLRTDIEELLPEDAQSVKDLKKAQGRVTGLNHLEVLIESKNNTAAKKFQIDLTNKIQENLVPEIASKVKNNIREERKFFEDHKSLYVDLKDWELIRDYIKEKKRREKNKAFSIGLEDTEATKEPTLDFEALKKKYQSKANLFAHFKEDYFQSKDGGTRIILAFLPGKVTDMGGNKRLSEEVHKIAEQLNPKSYAQDMVIGYGGDVQNVVEEHHGLVHDLISSFVIVTVLVTLVLLLYYRSIGAVNVLTITLFAGTFWTFAVSYFSVGYLNANTAFLGSIVIGNGINFGIILLARYMEERKKSIHVKEALIISLSQTARATFTAAFAAGLSYGSLIVTSFRGFSQFGVIGGLGMFFCWVAFYFYAPAVIFFFEKRSWISFRQPKISIPLMQAAAVLITKRAPWILFISALISIFSLYGITRFSEESLESDLSKLRNKESMETGSGYWGKKTDRAFNRNLTPTMILTDSVTNAEKIEKKLREIHKREAERSPFFEINTIHDLLPKNQKKVIETITEVRSLLPPKLIAKLNKEEQALVRELLPEKDFSELKATDLPPDLLASFKESNSEIGRMVHVYTKLNLPEDSDAPVAERKTVSGTWNGKEVIRYTNLMREAMASAGVDAAIAGQAPVSADMLATIGNDGPKATAFALIAVSLLVIFMFPKIKHAGAILLALYTGVLWMAGVMGVFDLKINFLNFITLPITFGIGVDYAVNIFGRYYEEKGSSITNIIHSTGGAVLLCSATTIIGYSSLLFSGSQAFVSFGRLAVLGEITCILVAIFSLPAVWVITQKEKTTP